MKLINFGLVLGLVAMAQPTWAYVADGGQEYQHSCNNDGMVLQSVKPITRLVGPEDNRSLVSDTEIIYLGKDCDAFSEVLGQGSWSWANGGFFLWFKDYKIRFIGQEMSCPAGEPDPFELQCQH